MGSAIDCALTTPSMFNREYFIANTDKPTGLLGKFVAALPPGLRASDPEEMYKDAYDIAGYKKDITWVIDFFWKNKDVVEYYKALHDEKVDGRKVLDKATYKKVMDARDLIMGNEFTYPYFFVIKDDMELLHQVPIYFEYKGVQCKSMLDGIRIDHKEKTIEPFDLKTTSKNLYQFPESFVNYGYYRQCAFYEVAIQTDDSPVKKYLDEGYKIVDFVFIVVSVKRNSTHPALIFKTSKNDRMVGIKGGYLGDRKVKGIDDLIDDYLWHMEHDYWELPRDLVATEGVVDLDIFQKN